MQWTLCLPAACVAALAGGSLSGGCNLGGGVDLDAGTDGDAGSDGGDADERDAPEPDAEGEPAGDSGPATLLFREISVSDDRTCDLDGDGVVDNAIANLGDPASSLLAAVVSALFAAPIERGSRAVLHLPRVEDLSFAGEQEVLSLVIGVTDLDRPRDPADDFSGDEPFYADVASLGPCGEPTREARLLTIDGGAFSSDVGIFTLPMGSSTLSFHESLFTGSIAPGAASAELEVCGYLTIWELGEECLTGDECAPEEPSALELFLAGGTAFGTPGIPGVSPDVDVDGDGLERFELDGEGRIARCIDGDGTPLEGRSCWQDGRMADGISSVIRVDMVRGRLVGREPGWEHAVDALLCEGGPPAESVLDIGDGEGPCAGLDEVCDPRLPEPCCEPDHRCVGDDKKDFRCFRPCDPSPCAYGDRVGLCRADGLCWPISSTPDGAGCELEQEGCTTEYGTSTATQCIGDGWGGTICLETCESLPDDCAEADRWCLPLAFEEGGVCAYTPESWPE